MSTGRLPKARVLVVDDKPTNLVALAALLESAYTVLHASSGPAAIALVKDDPTIDVILMDVQMPGMDGFEAAAAIKKLDGGQDIPIIFVTAVYSDDPFVKKGYASGGIDYFSKPFDPEILKLKVGVYASFRMRNNVLKERERHLRESEELLRVGRKLSAVLEELPVGVLIVDLDGRICQTTEQVSRILKADAAAESDSYGEILGWWDRSGKLIRDAGTVTRALREGASSHSEPLEVACLDGSRKTILASSSPLRGLDGRTVGAVVLIQDLTETKKIEVALQERVARLIGAGVELEESTTGIS